MSSNFYQLKINSALHTIRSSSFTGKIQLFNLGVSARNEGLSRGDSSSVNRHKEKWYKGEESRSYTFVSITAPEVRSLRNDLKKSEIQQQISQKTESSEFLKKNSSPTNQLNLVTSQSIDLDQESDSSKQRCFHIGKPIHLRPLLLAM